MKQHLGLCLAALCAALSGCGSPGGDGAEPPPEVSSLTSYYGNARVKLGWKEPSDAAYTGAEISGSGFATATVPKGTNRKAIIGLANDTEYSFTVTALYGEERSEGLSIKATPNGGAGSNLVENGSFADGLRSWRLDVGRDWGSGELGYGTIAVESGVLHVSTTEIGDDFDISRLQAVQKYPGFYLRSGKSYRVSFDAWADAARSLSVSVWENGRDLDGNGSKWFPYGGVKDFTLGTTSQTFSYDIAMTLDNDDAGMAFFCGSSLGDSYIDNVSIEELD